MNGFYISYIGFTNHIEVGWYLKDKEHGNFMVIDASNMSVEKEGWY